jgi:hypothetical protein
MASWTPALYGTFLELRTRPSHDLAQPGSKGRWLGLSRGVYFVEFILELHTFVDIKTAVVPLRIIASHIERNVWETIQTKRMTAFYEVGAKSTVCRECCF